MERVHFALVLATISLVALISALNVQPARATTYYVPDDYAKIQWALGNASDGDTIYVRNGIYNESLVISKEVNLTGQSNVNTIINATGHSQAIRLNTSDAIIQGFTIRYASGHQIYGYKADRNIIRGNRILFRDFGSHGIEFKTSLHNKIYGNHIELVASVGAVKGIELTTQCQFTMVHGNTIKGCSAQGMEIDSSAENTMYHNSFINNAVHAIVTPPSGGGGTTPQNNWHDGYPSGGNYWSGYSKPDSNGDGILDVPYTVAEHNVDEYPLKLPWIPPDISVDNITTSKTIVGEGYTADINVTVDNSLGRKVEGFDLNAYANGSLISSEYAMVYPYSSVTTTFVWNTTGWGKGNYRISAYAEPIKWEEDTSDNNLEDGWVFVTIPGDVDGDRDVDIFDIVKISAAYGSSVGDPQYDPNCDIDSDGDVDQDDLNIALSHYGQSW